MINFYIYKITIDNKNSSLDGCYYIGKRRCKCNIFQDVYFGSGFYIKKYIKKYGTFGLKKEILLQCKTEEEYNNKEKFYINNLNQEDNFCNGGKCLNIMNGGDGGDMLTNHPKREKIIQKINKNRNKKRFNIKINNILYDSKRDASRTLKIPISRINKYLKTNNEMFLDDGLYGNYLHGMRSNLLKGKTYNEIYGEEKAKILKQNISNMKKGKKISKESIIKREKTKKERGTNRISESTKKKMSLARLEWQKTHVHTCVGRYHTEEAKRKIGEKNRIALTGKKQSKELIEKRFKNIIGKKHYNNGIEQGFFYPGQEPNGWVLGKIKRK